MSRSIEIHVAELVVGEAGTVITTNGVGSCIVIVLYDRLSRIGGMAHAILPHHNPNELYVGAFKRDSDGRLFMKYADRAVDVLLSEFSAHGSPADHLVAKLIGGAHMFTLLEGDKHGIGWENTESARQKLAESGIAIETEVVGGTVGRNIRFDCATGIVEITTKV